MDFSITGILPPALLIWIQRPLRLALIYESKVNAMITISM